MDTVTKPFFNLEVSGFKVNLKTVSSLASAKGILRLFILLNDVLIEGHPRDSGSYPLAVVDD